MQLCGAIKNRYDNEQTMNKPLEILVDVIGLGAGVVDRLLEVGLLFAQLMLRSLLLRKELI